MLAPFDGYFGEPREELRRVLKVVPDDTMRGLELRKGTVDLVVNDLSPDIVCQTAARGASGHRHGARDRLRVHRPQPARTRCCSDPGPARDRYAIDRDAIVEVPAPRVCHGRCRHRAAHVLGVRARGLRLPPRPCRSQAVARRGRLSGPRRRRSAAPAAALAQDVDLRGLSRSSRGDPGRSRARRHRSRRQVEEFATLFADVLRGNFQMYTLQLVGVTDPDMLRRVFHSRQTPPAGLNRVHYSNPEVDRLIEAAASAVTTMRGGSSIRARSSSSPMTCRTSACGTRPTWPCSSLISTAFACRRSLTSRSSRIYRVKRLWPRNESAMPALREPGDPRSHRRLRIRPLRSTAALSDNLDAAVRHSLSPGRRGTGPPPGGARRACCVRARDDARPAVGTRAGDPRRSKRSLEWVGDADSLQHHRDRGRVARGRELDREH